MIPGGGEWLIIIAVVAVLFGASQIPKLARSIGKAKGEFKKGIEEGGKEEKKEKSEKKEEKTKE